MSTRLSLIISITALVSSLAVGGFYLAERMGFRATVLSLTGYTGQIGEEDIYWDTDFDGADDKFSVPTYSGGSEWLTQIDGRHVPFANASRYMDDLVDGGYDVDVKVADLQAATPVADIRAYGAIPDDGLEDSTAMLAAQAAVGNGTIQLADGVYDLGASIVLTCTMKILCGASLRLNTYNPTVARLVAPPCDVIDENSTGRMNITGLVYASWWGTDTDAVQRAFYQAGRQVILTQDYALTDRIELDNDTYITAWPDTVLTQTGIDKNIFYGDSVSNITIDGKGNLTLVGRLVTEVLTDNGLIHCTDCDDIRILDTEIHTGYELIFLLSGSRAWVQKNKLHNFQEHGCVLSRTVEFHFDHNEVYDCAESGASNAYGIQATGIQASGDEQKWCSINFNHFDNIKSWAGIMSHDTSSLKIIGNEIRDVRIGMTLGADNDTNVTQNIIVLGNYIEGTDTDTWAAAAANNAGIILYGRADATNYQTPTAPITNVVVSNNIVTNFNLHNASGAMSGIWLANIENVSVTGNVCYNNHDTWTSGAGIVLNGVVHAASVRGNSVFASSGEANPQPYGVTLYQVKYGRGIVVTGNSVRDSSGNMTAGIRADTVNCVDCVIRDNVADGIPVYSFAIGVPYGPMPFCDYASYNVNEEAFPVARLYSKINLYTSTDQIAAGGMTLKKRVSDTIQAVVDTNTIDVTSTANMDVGDIIHILKDVDEAAPYTHSTTIALIVDADTIDVTNPWGGACPGAACDVSAGNEVYVLDWVRDDHFGVVDCSLGCVVERTQKNHYIHNNGAGGASVVAVLPDAIAGYGPYCFVKNDGGTDLHVDPFDAADVIREDAGVACGAGKKLYLDAVGESACLYSFVSGVWEIIGTNNNGLACEP